MENNKKYIINDKNLMKEWNYKLNNKLEFFPDTITIGSHKKVYWQCKDCGYEWQAEVKCRTRKDGKATGCPMCGKKNYQNIILLLLLVLMILNPIILN